MTCKNLGAIAKKLGVDMEDVRSGGLKIARYLGEHRDVPLQQRQIDAIKTLPEREMIAIIRMDEWDIYRPDIFTRDGLREES